MPVHRVRRFAFVARATTRTSALLLARPCRRGLATATDDPRDSPSKGYVYSSLGLSVDVNNDAQRTAERPVEHALVVGGGVAGLATAACLGRLGVLVTIAVGEGQPKRKLDPGIGIWTHGLDCLDKLGVLQQLEAEGRYMGEAGYKDTSGRWLARPSKPLRAFSSSRTGAIAGKRGQADDKQADVSVLFVRESKLLDALRSCLAPSTDIVHKTIDCLRWDDDESKKFGDRAGRGAVEASDTATDADSGGAPSSWTGPFDLVVGADGPRSFVRRRLLTNAAERAQAGYAPTQVTAACGADPERRGYMVYCGVCKDRGPSVAAAAGGEGVQGSANRPRPGEWGLESFQTWGPGLRFASVPLSGNERMWFATVADGNDGFPDTGAATHERHPPSADSDAKKPFLLNTFKGWHAPIADLLRATEEGDITADDARAMSASGLKLAAGACAGGIGRAGGLHRRVVLVGDAAHTLDPVLAQGAGVALEDAFFLARCLKDFNRSVMEVPLLRSPSVGGDRVSLEAALKKYDEDRLQRALLLSRLSDVSQTLGQLRPSSLARLRNGIMSVTPNWIKSRSFDGFMGTALAGGRASEAISAAAAAVGARGGRPCGGYRVPGL